MAEAGGRYFVDKGNGWANPGAGFSITLQFNPQLAPAMTQQPLRQFQVAAFVGSAISLVASTVVAVNATLLAQLSFAPNVVELFAVVAVTGLIISAIALMFAWKSSRAFADCPLAYVAAAIGVALPGLLVCIRFAQIIQRLVT